MRSGNRRAITTRYEKHKKKKKLEKSTIKHVVTREKRN